MLVEFLNRSNLEFLLQFSTLSKRKGLVVTLTQWRVRWVEDILHWSSNVQGASNLAESFLSRHVVNVLLGILVYDIFSHFKNLVSICFRHWVLLVVRLLVRLAFRNGFLDVLGSNCVIYSLVEVLGILLALLLFWGLVCAVHFSFWFEIRFLNYYKIKTKLPF